MVNRRFSREAYWGTQFALYMRDTKISPLLAGLPSSRQRALLRSQYLESMAGPGSKVLLLGLCGPQIGICPSLCMDSQPDQAKLWQEPGDIL